MNSISDEMIFGQYLLASGMVDRIVDDVDGRLVVEEDPDGPRHRCCSQNFHL